MSLADKYAPVSSTPLYNSLATPVRPVPPLGYRHVAAKGPSPALAGRELQEVNIDAVEYPPSREAPVRKPRKEPKLIEKARFAKKIGEIVLQVKISQRDFPSPRDPSDVVIEAFEEIAGERFILSASTQEVAAAAGCSVEDLETGTSELWGRCVDCLHLTYDTETEQPVLQLSDAPIQLYQSSSARDSLLTAGMIIEARGKGGQWTKDNWSKARIVRCNTEGGEENRTYSIKFLDDGGEAVVTDANIRILVEETLSLAQGEEQGEEGRAEQHA